MLFIERAGFRVGPDRQHVSLGNIVAVLMVARDHSALRPILRIPFAIIGPVIVVVCFVGACTVGKPSVRSGAGPRPSASSATCSRSSTT